MDKYTPGLHILCTFSSTHENLTNVDACKRIFDDLITTLSLTKVGEVYHAFSGAGYTAIVCLTESHISIHTWPEHGIATFDVFLSNFHNDNSEKVKVFYKSTLHAFEAVAINTHEVLR